MIEAMKQALEALECLFGIPEQFTGKGGGDVAVWTLGGSYRAQQAIPALRQAIEQAEKQEPLEYWNAVEGWVKVDEVRQHFDSVGCGTIYKNAGEDRVPLYTAPQREWVGLTDEEMQQACYETFSYDPYVIARAIEAKLKEKNT